MQEKMEQMQVQLVQAISRDTNTENESNETRREKAQENIVKKQVRYRENRMDQFVSCFHEEYGDYQQVSMNEIRKLVMNVRVTDPRSIQNRIDYLKATGCIESFAPNVYNVRF